MKIKVLEAQVSHMKEHLYVIDAEVMGILRHIAIHPERLMESGGLEKFCSILVDWGTEYSPTLSQTKKNHVVNTLRNDFGRFFLAITSLNEQYSSSTLLSNMVIEAEGHMETHHFDGTEMTLGPEDVQHLRSLECI